MDSLLPDASIGFLYLVPVLFSAAALNNLADPGVGGVLRLPARNVRPVEVRARRGRTHRRVVAGFAMTGFFVAELNQRRRTLAEHLAEREEQIRLRREAEQQVRVLIETSPLAILTLDHDGQIVLANESARELLGFDEESLQGATWRPTCRFSTACCAALRPPTCAPMWNPRASGATARSSWPTCGSPPTAPRKAPDWQRWSGTRARTCATARARASIR